MKQLRLFFLLIIISFAVHAQAPQALNYQAVARNPDGSIISGQQVKVRFSILDISSAGRLIYQESHLTNTNNFGLFTLAIGKGSALSGSFSAINWGTGDKFLKVEIAFNGSSNYQVQGTTQLLSVPYAIYAEKSGSLGLQGPVGATGPQGPAGPQGVPGSIGPQGIAGVQGLVGPQGFTGAIGPQGTTGSQGSVGSQGLLGPIGPQGPAGMQGAIGTAGSTGAPGPQGPAGPQGLMGTPGSPGLKSLIDMESVTSSTSCPLGGVIVKSGVDLNSNNVLDANEVDNIKPICFSQNVALDKVIVIPIVMGSGWGFATTTPYIVRDNFGTVAKFNKNNYPGIDSVTFVCNPYVQNAGNSVTVQLFNITDDLPVPNSTITTTNFGNGSPTVFQPFLESGNLFSSLPNYDVSLGISIQSGTSGMTVLAGACYLYLYRR